METLAYCLAAILVMVVGYLAIRLWIAQATMRMMADAMTHPESATHGSVSCTTILLGLGFLVFGLLCTFSFVLGILMSEQPHI